MALLIHSNKYLRDPVKRRRMLEQSAYESSVLEGARGLKRRGQSSTPSKRRKTASTKRSVKGAKSAA